MLSIVILAIVQGISEFLPISSSAHLIIFRDIFLLGSGVISDEIELTFDIALHFGTALAIFVYFFKDFCRIIVDGISKSKNNKAIFHIIISTIPAAIVGFLFEDVIDSFLRTKYILISLALIFMGVIIYYADKKMNEAKSIDEMSIKDAILIGIGQVFSLIPGFSRSGTTIAMARMLNINRTDSAKYSFYLSFPVVLGAVILQLIKTDINILKTNIHIFTLGIFLSFLVGILVIKLLFKYIQKKDYKIFMWYRLALGLFVLLYLIIK